MKRLWQAEQAKGRRLKVSMMCRSRLGFTAKRFPHRQPNRFPSGAAQSFTGACSALPWAACARISLPCRSTGFHAGCAAPGTT